MKIYRKAQSIQVSYIFFKQSEAFFSIIGSILRDINAESW